MVNSISVQRPLCNLDYQENIIEKRLDSQPETRINKKTKKSLNTEDTSTFFPGSIPQILPQISINTSIPPEQNRISLISSPLYHKAVNQITIGEKAPSPSIEAIFHDIMMTLLGQSMSFLELQKKLIEGEKEWKETIYKQIEKVNLSLHEVHAARNSTSAITKFLGPIGLIATGAIAISTGAATIFAAGAAVLGGLILTDSILDDAAKKTVAGWLAQTSNETKETWLGRLHFFTTMTTLGISLGLDTNQSVTIATHVANVALKTIEAGTDIQEKHVQALLTEIEHTLQKSENMLQTHVEALKRLNSTLKNFFESLSQVYKSLQTTYSYIHA